LDEGVLLKLVSFGDELVKDGSPKLLAEMLEYDFLDLAKNDTSNQQIFRDVIKYLCELETKDCFILIGWTNGKRLEINWKDQNFTYRPDVNDYPDNEINALHFSDDIMFDDILIGQHRASEAYVLQEVLLSEKINYYMYNTQDCIVFNEKTYSYLRALKGRYYHNPLNKDSSMKYFLEKQNPIDHRSAWAEFLRDKIK
jgi:hypothetical protein